MRYSILVTAALVAAPAVFAAPPTKKPAKKAPARKAPAKPAAAPQAAQPKAQQPPQEITLGNLVSQVPGAWKNQPPGGQFRLAQYAIPQAAGDTASALFIVYHFGKGGGGSVEDNMRRWVGMMRQPEGADPARAAKRDRVERPGLRIHTLDMPGTYLERPFPMSDQITERPNYRMLAAVVETTGEGGDGPYFVRLVGPAKSIDAARAGWDAFLASLKAP